LHWATGHYRNGVLLAPITAEIVVGGLAGEELPELAGPFAPDRFITQTAHGNRAAPHPVGA
jgi:glycine oxidase